MSQQQAVLRIPDVPSEMTEVTIVPEVVVAGDHPVVLVMADRLASMGISVTLVHPFDDLEALVMPFWGYIESDADVEKRFAFIHEKVADNRAITVMNNTVLNEVSGWWGNFTIRVSHEDKASSLKASGLAVAYRGNPELQEKFSLEGVETFKDFLSRFDLRRRSLKEAVNPIGKVAFILDVDGRDEKWAGVTALRFGAYLRGFGSQVYILCRDMKVSVDDMEADYREARESGILIFKYQDLPRIEGSRPNMRVVFKDASAVSDENPFEVTLEDLNAVVVQEKILNSDSQWKILEQLRIAQEDGVVGPNNPQFIGRTSKKGVVVAGDTWFPEYPTDAYMTALSAAEELVKWVGKGSYQIDAQRVAEVDPSKCATCLTCYRICPHDSIRIEKYGERNVYITKGEKEGATWEAARVKIETCNGCGLCASECPAKAIQLVYYPDMEVLEFLENN